MAKDLKPIGELFTHVYLERGTPLQDSELFRRRLGGYVDSELSHFHSGLTNFIKRETGLTVLYGVHSYLFEEFFAKVPIHHLLNLITLVWRHLGNNSIGRTRDWLLFVRRVLVEENLCYTVDEKCGVHYSIDQEFEHNRASTLRCLDAPRYGGVLAAFEDGHRYLVDVEKRDTKASVRSIFESLEILTKLMISGTTRLTKDTVENKLKPIVREVYAGDEIAIRTISSIFDGFAQWVDGLHNYRHGQGLPEPVAPPLGFAIFIFSSGAAYLRWLIEIDSAMQLRSLDRK